MHGFNRVRQTARGGREAIFKMQARKTGVADTCHVGFLHVLHLRFPFSVRELLSVDQATVTVCKSKILIVMCDFMCQFYFIFFRQKQNMCIN